jgi:hypothetical protein
MSEESLLQDVIYDDEIQKKGLKAILFSQSMLRMVIGSRRHFLISQGKIQILDIMKQINIDNGYNENNVLNLKEMLRYYRQDLGMICYILKDADHIIEKYDIIENIKNEAIILFDSSQDIIASIDGTGNYGDIIVEEYQAYSQLINQINELNINVKFYVMDIYNKMIIRQNELKNKSISIIDIRESIDTFDEDIIMHKIIQINKLKEEYGEYCKSDLDSAKEVLVMINIINNSQEKSISIITLFQEKIEEEINSQKISDDKIIDINAIMLSESLSEWLKDNLPIYIKDLDDELTIMQQEWVNANTNQQNNAPYITIIINIIESIHYFRKIWRELEYSVISEYCVAMNDAMKELNTFLNQNEIKIPSNLQSKYDNLKLLINKEIDLIQIKLEVHELLPAIKELIYQGKIDGSGRKIGKIGNIDFSNASIGYEESVDYINDIKLSGICSMEFNKFISRIDILLKVRKSCIDEYWESSLNYTEIKSNSQTRHSRLLEVYSLLSEHYKESQLVENSITSLSNQMELDDFPNGVNLSIAKSQISSYSDFLVDDIKYIESELELCRMESFNRYVQLLLTVSVSVSKLSTDSNGKLDLENTSVNPLEIILKEIRLLCLNSDDSLLTTASIIIDRVDSLSKIRNYAINKKWSLAVEFVKEKKLQNVLESDITSDSFHDHLLHCLEEINEEVFNITLYCNSYYIYDKLLIALCNKDESMHGDSLDLVKISNNNTEEKSHLLKIVNESIILLNENKDNAHLFENCKKLKDICQLVITTRKLFSEGTYIQQKESIELLNEFYLNFIESTELPEEIGKEITLMKEFHEYNNVITDLENSLKHNSNNCEYFIVAKDPIDPEDEDVCDLTDNLLVKDNIYLNKEMLNTTNLEGYLAIAYEFKNNFDENKDLPQKLIKIMRSCELLILLRINIQNLNWTQASSTVYLIETSDLLLTVPDLSIDLNACSYYVSES